VTRAFKLFPRLRGAAGHTQDPSEHDCEPELKVVSIPSFTKVRITLRDSWPSPHPSFESSTGILCTYY
jgi:hypothetical protein